MYEVNEREWIEDIPLEQIIRIHNNIVKINKNREILTNKQPNELFNWPHSYVLSSIPSIFTRKKSTNGTEKDQISGLNEHLGSQI